jgi:N-hydroxyarylamine O-acetyltransferase
MNMSTSGFDLNAYFKRIGYYAEARPTYDTLAAIQLQHAQAIPFENLNPLLKWPVSLDRNTLQQKLVRDGRGGYCFEQNLLFSHALRECGFRVSWLAARVVWNLPEGTATARGHMLLVVHLDDGPCVADVGFGGLTPTGPLRFHMGTEQTTPHEPFRLRMSEGIFILEARVGGVWKALYHFSMEKQQLLDYEVLSWYLSNHPQSEFVTSLIVARPDANRRYVLRDNRLTVYMVNGPTERYVLTSASALRATMEDVFRLNLPQAHEVDAALARVVAHASRSISEKLLLRVRLERLPAEFLRE